MSAIEVEGLCKRYGDLLAVDNISFEVRPGEIVGLIGPDGAGKTSTMRMIVTLLTPTGGRIRFQGRDALSDKGRVRAHIGYMPQRFSLYQDLTVEQNMRFFGDLFNIPPGEQQKQMEKLYTFSRLGPFKQRLAAQLSGGMKQKLALSCMLMHHPRVIVLDEPTFGVDPVSRHEFWEILHELRNEDVAILVSTAYMDEAMQCDKVGLMHEGRLLAMDRPRKLLSTYPGTLVRLPVRQPDKDYAWLTEELGENRVQLFGDGLHIRLDDRFGHRELTGVLARMPGDNGPPRDIKPGLEDLFLYLLEAQHD